MPREQRTDLRSDPRVSILQMPGARTVVGKVWEEGATAKTMCRIQQDLQLLLFVAVAGDAYLLQSSIGDMFRRSGRRRKGKGGNLEEFLSIFVIMATWAVCSYGY